MSGTSPYIPKNPCVQGILSLFDDGKESESTDVTFSFVVNDDDGAGQTEKLHAHKLILHGCAPTLAEYCESCKESNGNVPIKDVNPEIFRHLLHYVYGGTIPDDILKEHAKELIESADRFGVGHLKVAAEAFYVKDTTITMNNFIDSFYLADTKKCALLKEKVYDFLVENNEDALEQLSRNQEVPQSHNMLTDVLTAMLRGKRKRDDYEGNDPYLMKTMSVDTMRKKLDERGLSVDGTREMLIDTLQKSVNTNEVIVEGAGATGVNGTYVRDGDYGGIPKYKKAGPEEDVEYTMFCSKSRSSLFDSEWCWYISTKSSGNGKAYLYSKTSDERIPATGRWRVYTASTGYKPAPIVSFKDIPMKGFAGERRHSL